MRTRPSIFTGTVVPTLAVVLGAAASASAATCADRTVHARGEPSRFEVLAKAKARGNWRAQVRAMPGLGAPYANWNIAQAADYLCTEDAAGYICTAAGRPCRE